MALHESVLEEFGLAPLWVRRGMASPQQPVAGDVAADDAAVSPAKIVDRAGPRVSAPESSASVDEHDDRRPAMPAGEGQQAASVKAPVERRAPVRMDEMQQPAQTQNQLERQAPVRANESSRAGQGQRLDERRAPPEQSEARPPAQQPREPEPQAFDAPSDDDFAWFDDLPAHPPGETHREAPQPPAIQTLDWNALSERVAACQLCRLCEKRTNTVFGVGDRNADWMLIGEAPGENEDRQGEPFVGQAGKLLDNMLRSLALARDTNVYIANVIKCRPPGNRNPEPDEVARCEPYLQRQVALVKPKLIVALGRFAAQSLLKTEASISSLRGRVHEYEGVPVIVTYHPAYLLRSLPDKAKAWADLCLARDTWRAAGGAAPNDAK
ncbi:uracil-DNA glycosylase family protein [Paraburkholderia fungorum]|uniref:uracil-DNA glycosylase family protein n=1 Tax=Paraburkholderia fungorum TaxID=134537 RepID=UPI0038B80C92